MLPGEEGIIDRAGNPIRSDYCGDSRVFRTEDDCKKHLKMSILTDFDKLCKGKQTCEFKPTDYLTSADNGKGNT